MAYQCSVPALDQLREIFTNFDTSNSGSLSREDCYTILFASVGSPVVAARIVHAMGRMGNDRVDWTEFLGAALCISMHGNSDYCKRAIATIGGAAGVSEGSNAILVEDLIEVFCGEERGGD